jgi:hypothetical protein
MKGCVMKTVHLIFKTHLDYGFTDFAASVFRKYCERYIPQAMARARELRESGTPERFVWTTGSWLIYEYLEQADAKGRREMEKSIASGDIVWHALPYTLHTELADRSLFLHGLSLAKELERRFGYKTISGKMTDVPGHCRAIVPMLAEAGIQFLHIGVNPASTRPKVPPVFRWQSPDGSEIIVAYSSEYGTPFRLKGLDDALAFAHSGDNCGPPPGEEIRKDFDRWRETYQGAKVIGSTLDAFAKKLIRIRASLPVVTDEIGDTWIHGVGTDPLKVSQYRALCRLRRDWEKKGWAKKYRKAFRTSSQFLLNIAEHTWGLDEKTHLNDFVNYGPKELARARKTDLVSASSVPPEYQYFRSFIANSKEFDNSPRDRRFSTFSSSWTEQREFITRAVRAVAGTPMAAEARRELLRTKPVRLSLRGFEPLKAGEATSLGQFTVRFDPKTGAINHLQVQGEKSPLCTREKVLGLFRYQTFSAADYERFLDAYLIHRDRHGHWAVADFSKPGMETTRPKPRHAFFASEKAVFHLLRGKGGRPDVVVAVLRLPREVCRQAGAPHEVLLRYSFPRAKSEIGVELLWFGKPATRLPEAAWLSFDPKVPSPEAWQMEKMGEWISPLKVCSRGNRNLHAIDQAVRNVPIYIESLDAPLVAPGAPRLLEFDDTQPPLDGGMHFNLHNNVWGTNFPMWYEDDALFRFTVHLKSEERPARAER